MQTSVFHLYCWKWIFVFAARLYTHSMTNVRLYFFGWWNFMLCWVSNSFFVSGIKNELKLTPFNSKRNEWTVSMRYIFFVSSVQHKIFKKKRACKKKTVNSLFNTIHALFRFKHFCCCFCLFSCIWLDANAPIFHLCRLVSARSYVICKCHNKHFINSSTFSPSRTFCVRFVFRCVANF